MYTDPKIQESIRKVEAARAENVKLSPARMSAEEKENLLKTFHPDYRENQFTTLRIGPNKGGKVPLELAALLEGKPRVELSHPHLDVPDYDADVLIIGGGGAGCAAAIEANNTGAKVLLVTKLRMGDANTMMAEGGIQAADKPNDSPAQHFLDAYGGGHFAAQKDLLYKLVTEAPEAIQWLSDLGVEFDKAPDGTMITTHGGGTSRKRMHAAKDYSGAEIMRTLRDEVLNRSIEVVDFTSAIELLLDETGRCAGAVLQNMETKEILVARAKTVILATGGAGRLHYQGFPTSNHYGATADGLVLGYRAGAKLLYPDTLQYHPTGAAFPAQIYGALVTEKVRSVGTISQDGLLYILKEEDNGWLYVESGNVRGFVKASEIYTEDAAQELLDVYQTQARLKASKENKDYTGIEGTAKTAQALVEAKDNQAYTYLRATVNQTVADKEPALVSEQVDTDKKGTLNIQEEKNADSRVVGTMTAGELCYILADEDSDWVYVESGDVRGFAEKKYLKSDAETKAQVTERGADSYSVADENMNPEENKALYYTLTSTKEGTPSGEIRQSMIEYASQFVGNPYVWGGTSLTNGADCSGFVQQIYKTFGYNLPRVAEDQSQYGTKIPVEDAQPGDLICYGGHVAIYMGNGQIVHASNARDGIKVSDNAAYRTITSVRRLV